MVDKQHDAKNFAIIKLGGSQLKVVEGNKYEVDKLPGEKGDKVTINDVLMVVNGEDVAVGTPNVDGASVELKIDSQKRGEKIRVFKYKSKSRYRRTYGHRQDITRVEVTKIASK